MPLIDQFSMLNAKALNAYGRDVVVDGVTRRVDLITEGDVEYLGGVSADVAKPYMIMLSGEAPAQPEGKIVLDAGKKYAICTPITPDGFGYTRMHLERKP